MVGDGHRFDCNESGWTVGHADWHGVVGGGEHVYDVVGDQQSQVERVGLLVNGHVHVAIVVICRHAWSVSSTRQATRLESTDWAGCRFTSAAVIVDFDRDGALAIIAKSYPTIAIVDKFMTTMREESKEKRLFTYYATSYADVLRLYGECDDNNDERMERKVANVYNEIGKKHIDSLILKSISLSLSYLNRPRNRALWLLKVSGKA